MGLDKKPAAVVAIAGNIGVGKSTFVRAAVSDQYQRIFLDLLKDYPHLPKKVKAYEERFDPPLLGLYSDCPEVYALPFQVSMLIASTTLEGLIAIEGGIAFLDRTIYEHRHVFGKLQNQLGRMVGEDFQIYDALFQRLSKNVPPPLAYIYLQASEENLRKRIAQRGRPQEQWLLQDKNYLHSLECAFEEFFARHVSQPVIQIKTDDIFLSGDGEIDHHYFERTLPYVAQKMKELKLLEKVR